MIIRWEDPPTGPASYDWAAIGAVLATRPTEWALVAIAANSPLAGQMASHIRNGRYDQLALLGRFEAKSRTVKGEHRVYARFLGALSP